MRDDPAEDYPHLHVGVSGASPPPVALSCSAAPETKGEKVGVERLQGRCSVREITVDLAGVQEPACAPDKTPLQAVVHATASQSEGSTLARYYGFATPHPAQSWTQMQPSPFEPSSPCVPTVGRLLLLSQKAAI